MAGTKAWIAGSRSVVTGAGGGVDRAMAGGGRPRDRASLPAGTTATVVTADGAALAITDVGAGPAVVLVHGWTEQRQVWAPVTRRLLAAGHRVVLYDQRGHGSSSIGRDGCTIERLGTDLQAVLEATGVTDAVLTGHSMGGMTILALATAAPAVLAERARGLALVSTGAAGLGQARAVEVLGRMLLGKRWFVSRFRGRLGPLLVRATFGRNPRGAHLRLMADLFAASDDEARIDFAAAIQAMDLRECLPRIALPTVVVVGTRDRLTPPHQADALAMAIPGAGLVRLEGRGHQLPLEAPDEVTAAIVGLR